jgi:hypothetical protein
MPPHRPGIIRLLLSASSALVLAFAGLTPGAALRADALSRKTEVDFFRDGSSRDLHGLAARSDGRLVGGPALTELKGDAPAELLWCLEPAPHGGWFVGTGPDGRIFEINVNPATGGYTSREVAKLGESQVFALKRLPDGSLLAGTSPKGALCLIRGGKTVARIALPVDSIFDLLLLGDGTALAATGNPGRIYRIDLAKFARAGLTKEKVSDAKGLADRGIAQFGEIRDRNVRRLARLADSRIAAGSSPRGNVYLFGPTGGAPFLAQENHDAEVTDLLADPAGGFYASLVFSNGETHLSALAVRAKEGAPETIPLTVPAQIEKFVGRSTLVWFPPDGFPETLTARSGVAFYRLARQGQTILIGGGEQGELLGYDLVGRMALTFAGSTSAQVNALLPWEGAPGRFLALRNNAPGFALLDFATAAVRRAETRPIDLGMPGRLGAVRFDRLRDLAGPQLGVSVATSNGSDELEGWSPWVPLHDQDGWRGATLRGRYVRLRLEIAAGAPATLEVDKAAIYDLPQNRRPSLQEFRLLSANYAVVVPPETPAPVTTTVSQLLAGSDAEKRRSFLSSQIFASLGTRVAFWSVNDPDGDNLLYTFSLRRDGDAGWTDVSVDSREAYAQFETLHLPEGTYFTRLIARETAPRPVADRLAMTFETDNLIVDHTPPILLETTARRTGDHVIITVHGRDALSLLDSLEVVFNNGVHEMVEQPADGVLDGREETFVLEEKLEKVAGATSAEITLYDAAGNGATRRLTW